MMLPILTTNEFMHQHWHRGEEGRIKFSSSIIYSETLYAGSRHSSLDFNFTFPQSRP